MAGMRPSTPHLAGVLASLLTLGACATGYNYADPDGPRYAGPRPVDAAPGAGVPDSAGAHRGVAVLGVAVPGPAGDTLRVVSFNVEHAERVDSALRVLTETPELQGLDVVLLQEMDEEGTRRIARALDMGYVYYPASYREGIEKDFGNAVLSRWPVVEDAKILLPHRSVFTGSQRTATAATLRVRGHPVRVYSVHLETVVNQWPWRRDDQLRTVLEDAAPYGTVVVGGDMNSGGMGEVAMERGYDWPTRDGPDTVHLWRWDHIFVRGLAAPANGAAGTVLDNRGASDHRPVWVRVVLPSG